MRIQYLNNVVEEVSKGGKSWNKMSATYKNLDNGKVEVKGFVDFATDQAVWDRLKKANKDEVFVVDTEKDEKGYWKWAGIHRDDGPVPASPVAEASKAATGTWADKNALDRERFEFEKSKQQLIIRQSCLSSAVGLAKNHTEALAIADVFVDWVNQAGMAGLTDDVPV